MGLYYNELTRYLCKISSTQICIKRINYFIFFDDVTDTILKNDYAEKLEVQ